jgi:hypothetical protein
MDVDRIKARVADLAKSPKNVRFEELETLLDSHIGHLFGNYSHRDRGSHHAFTLGDKTFNIKKPNAGCVNKVYVRQFLNVMEELGLYDPEE